MLKILFFGDIVGKPGRKAVAKVAPTLKKEFQPDIIIANAENLAHGLGVTEKTLAECQRAGIDFFTSGNHIWKKPAIHEIFKDPDAPIIRPANYPDEMPGLGYKTLLVGTKSLLVINLNGQVFIDDQFTNPFHKIDQILKKHQGENLAGIIVDFHAEVTSEKIAMGWHLDGRVAAIVGTHTHIVTADEKILPQGTAYITDVGMAGLKESVIGINTDIILNNFINEKTKAHDIAEHGQCFVNTVLIKIDPQSKKTTHIERICREVEV